MRNKGQENKQNEKVGCHIENKQNGCFKKQDGIQPHTFWRMNQFHEAPVASYRTHKTKDEILRNDTLDPERFVYITESKVCSSRIQSG